MHTDQYATQHVDLDDVAQRYAARAADDPAAREEFVRACLPMAHRLALRYSGRGEPFDDLEQAARLGLVKAVDRYDPERGSFTAFAVITMLGELRRHFRDRTWGVRAPRRLQDLLLQMRQTNADLSSASDRAELADRLDTTVDEVDRAVLSAAGYTLKSLNAPANDSVAGGAEYGDLLGEPDPDLAAVEDRLSLRDLLDRLPDRERQIVLLRFYGNYTQEQIANQCGISQMHVSRLLSRTMTWLRHAMLADVPPPWSSTTGGPLDLPRLAVTTASAGGVLTVAIGGEVDRDSAGKLRQAILDAIAGHPRRLRLDLSGVPFIDAAGVSAIVAGYQEAARAAVEFSVRGTQPHVRRVLAIAHLPMEGGR